MAFILQVTLLSGWLPEFQEEGGKAESEYFLNLPEKENPQNTSINIFDRSLVLELPIDAKSPRVPGKCRPLFLSPVSPAKNQGCVNEERQC